MNKRIKNISLVLLVLVLSLFSCFVGIGIGASDIDTETPKSTEISMEAATLEEATLPPSTSTSEPKNTPEQASPKIIVTPDSTQVYLSEALIYTETFAEIALGAGENLLWFSDMLDLSQSADDLYTICLISEASINLSLRKLEALEPPDGFETIHFLTYEGYHAYLQAFQACLLGDNDSTINYIDEGIASIDAANLLLEQWSQ